MIRLVLFDIDGTLIRTGGAGIRAFERAIEEEFGVVNGAHNMSFAGRTDPSLVREIFARHEIGASDGNVARFFARYVSLLEGLLHEHDGTVCSGVEELIQDLKTLSNPPLIGLQTGNIRQGAEIKLRHYGLWDHFRTGGFGDDHADRNGMAAVARDRGARELGRSLGGDEILVVGDTPSDIACGRAIDARVLAVATGGATLAELRSHAPDWAVADLAEVSARELCSPES